MAVADMKTEAAKIKKYLDSHHSATVQELSKKFEIPEDDTTAILNEWFVDENGNMAHLGDGKGGGWAPARAAEAEMLAAREES